MIIQQSIRKANSNFHQYQVWDLYGLYRKYQTKLQDKPKQNKITRNQKINKQTCQYRLAHPVKQHYQSKIQNQNNLFLNRYKILPSKQKTKKIWNRMSRCKSQKFIGLIYQVKYIKKQKNNGANILIKSPYDNNSVNINNNYQKILADKNFIQSKQIQRGTQLIFSKAKISNHGSISTKTATQTAHQPYSQIQEFNKKFINIKPGATTSCLIGKKQDNIKTMPQTNYINVIIEQSSQSKISKTNRKNSQGSKCSRSSIDSKSHGSLKSSFKNSIFLPLNSIEHSKRFQSVSDASELQGYTIIQNYMQLLSILANYAHQITQNYQNTEDWEQLIFLTYKKYYLYRLKLFNALFYRNTLFFESTGIKLTSSKKKSLKYFMNSQDGQILRKEIFRQNIQIADSLRNLYNLAIQKSGNYINLGEVNNFSCEIFRLMAQQIQQLQQIFFKQPQEVKNRLKSVIKCAMTVAKLDGKFEQQIQLGKLMKNSITIRLFQNIINLFKLKLV